MERNARRVGLGEAGAWKEEDRRVEEQGPGSRAALSTGALEGIRPSLSRTPAWGHDPPPPPHLQGGGNARGWATPKCATPDP